MSSQPSETPGAPDRAGATDATRPSRPAEAETKRAPAPQLKNDPARTGFDPGTQWWVNLFKIFTGQVTPEGQFHYREWRTRVHEARDCRQCEAWRDWCLAHSPTVVFLAERVGALNGRVDAGTVRCARCPAELREDGSVQRRSGGFDPNRGILLCANELRDRGHVEDTVAHELVHAWDHLRWKVDWAGDKDLRHAACTEIRAAALSGECRWTREAFTRGNLTVTQQFQNCVRQRAIESVMARARCKDEAQAAGVVKQVWDSCFSDTRPFDEVYR